MKNKKYPLLILMIISLLLVSCSIEQQPNKEEVKDTTPIKEEKKPIEYEYISFGQYPQSIKEENVEISEVVNDEGYYLGSDNNYYAKLIATPDSNNHFYDFVEFNNGTIINEKETYYFKVEPIKWQIIKRSDNNYFLITHDIIDFQKFTDSVNSKIIDGKKVYSNNYEHSEIRNWINNDFYNIAFSDIEKTKIQITNVDNSLKSTTYPNSQYTCGNTDDKVFLLSLEEMKQYTKLDEYRKDLLKNISDYTLAKGSPYELYLGERTSYWFIRTPSPNYDYFVNRAIVINKEAIDLDTNSYRYSGVVVGINVTIDTSLVN